MTPHRTAIPSHPSLRQAILLGSCLLAASGLYRRTSADCPGFQRGDCSGDRRFDISDPVRLLNSLFIDAGTVLPCRDACDTDDSGRLDITDAVRALDYLFRGGLAPPEPFVGCGLDPTADPLDCASPPRRCEDRAPAITSMPGDTATVGEVFAYRVEAVDPEGQPITYTLVTGAGGARLDAETGELRWTPARAQVGVEEFHVRASDPCGSAGDQTFAVSVLPAPPSVRIFRPRNGSIVNTSSPEILAEIEGAPDLASVRVVLDGSAVTAGLLVLPTGVGGVLPELRDGEHLLEVSFAYRRGLTASAMAGFRTSTGGEVTRVIGRVLDPETDEGIPGAEVFLDEAPANVVLTDGAGFYELLSPPPGLDMHLNFVPHCPVEGQRFCYPRYKRPVPVIAGATYEADPCYLPRIYPTVTFAQLAAAGIFDCESARFLRGYDLRSEALDVTLHFAAGTHVTFVDGLPPCEHFLSITEVDEDKAPSNLPADLDPFLLITVQPTGMRFWSGPPGEAAPLQLPVTFPNPERYAPGNEFELFSVDHETGRFAVMGRMAVQAEDPAHLVTIEGGLEGGSWHCTCPPDLDFDFSFEGGDPCSGIEVNPVVEPESGFVREYYELPAAFRFDQPVRRRLVYWSGSVLESRVVTTRVRIPVISAVPRWIVLRPYFGGGSGGAGGGGRISAGDGVWFDTSQLPESRPVTVIPAYFVDTTGLPEGLQNYEMEVTNVFGSSGRSATAPGQISVVRRQDSPFGRGWALEEDVRIVASPDGSVLVVEGSGEMLRFLPSERPEQPNSGPYMLASTDESVEPGAVATVTVHLSNAAAVEGFSFGLVHEPKVLEPRGARPGAVLAAANGGRGPDFFFSSEDATGTVVAAVVSTGAPVDSIPPGTRQEIVLVDYATNAAAATGTVSTVGFSAGAGPSPVAVVLSVAGLDVEPTVRGGSVAIGARPLDLVSFSHDYSRIEQTPGGYRRVHPVGSTDSFDRAGRIVSKRDRAGRATIYERNASGQLTAIVDPAGQRLELSYAGGRIAAITDGAGRTTRLTHDGADLVAVADPAGGTVRYGYDERGLLTSTTDRDGRANVHAYDRQGRYRQTEFADGSTFVLDPGNVRGLASGSTREAPAPQPPEGFVVSAYTDQGGRRFTLSNDRVAGVRRRIDPLGREETTWYDPRTRLVLRRENAMGFHESFAWDFQRGVLLERRQAGDPSTSSDDRVTRYEWHPSRAWLAAVTEAAGRPEERRTELSYNAAGLTSSIRLAGAGEQTLAWTASGALRELRDETGRVVNFDTDPSTGNTTAIRLGELTWELGRNGWGQIESVTRPGPERPVRRLDLDALGRILAVTDELGSVTRYVRLSSGRLNEIHDAKTPSAVTRIRYDAAGRTERVEYPDGAVEVFRYAAGGEVIEHADRRGRVLTLDYDLGRRLVRVREGMTVHLEYGYDVLDQLLRARAEGSELELDYSPFGEILREREIGTAAGHEVVYERDALGRVARRTLGFGGSAVLSEQFEHNARGQRTGVLASGGVPGAIAAFETGAEFERDSAGRLVRMVRSNGLESLASHDELGRLVSLSTGLGEDLVAADQLVWGPAGHLSEVTETRAGLDGAVHRFEFDLAGRLLAETLDSTAPLRIDYGPYDAAGNRQSDRHAYSADDRLLSSASEAFSYDRGGNLEHRRPLAGVGATLEVRHDFANRPEWFLRTDEDGTETEVRLSRDALGRLTHRNGTRLIYAGREVLALVEGAEVTALFVHGPPRQAPLARIDRNGVTWLVTDHMGSVVEWLRGAETVAAVRYSAFGEEIAAAGERGPVEFGYRGYLLDRELGLYHFGPRSYDAGLGRFYEREPEWRAFAGGAVPQGMHSYAYALNDPLAILDSSGLRPEPVGENGDDGGGVDLPRIPLGDDADLGLGEVPGSEAAGITVEGCVLGICGEAGIGIGRPSFTDPLETPVHCGASIRF